MKPPQAVLGYLTVAALWILCPGDATHDRRIAGASRRVQSKSWIPWGGKEYLFVLDSLLLLDKTRAGAKADCATRNADLVSIETEEELEFLKDNIRAMVKSVGQHLLEEKWWTNAMSYRQIKWIWDTADMPEVRLSALKRSTVPRNGPHFLALTHPAGWRLKVVPSNYHLRYICERKTPPEVPSTMLITNRTDADLDTVSRALRRQIFSGYDTSSPALGEHGAGSRVIEATIGLSHITDSTSNDTLNVKQNVTTKWHDPRLSWQPLMFGGIAYLRARMSEVWYPDLSFQQRGGHHSFHCQNVSPQNLLNVNASGHVTLEQTCDVIYNCTLDKRVLFPFDHKSCQLILRSESALNSQVVVRSGYTADGTEGLVFHNAWRVSSLDGYQTNLSAAHVQLTLYLHRNVIYHVLTLIVPCLFLSVVLLILLWLPHGSKVKCAATCLVTLAFLLYLLLGGQHRHRRSVTFSDMFMIVMSIIGAVSLATQIGILYLLWRQQRKLPPPPWVEKVVIKRSRKTLEKAAFRKAQEKKDKDLERLAANSKWVEEKELMLGDQTTLGMTSLGRDAKLMTSNPYHVTTTQPRDATIQIRDVRTAGIHQPSDHFRNGSAKRKIPAPPVVTRYQPGPRVFKETALYSDPKLGDNHSDVGAGSVSGRESLDSGCHSANVKNSPDVTIATPQGLKDSQWRKYVVWFDRAVSLVISAAVIFTIMIFTILYLAT